MFVNTPMPRIFFVGTFSRILYFLSAYQMQSPMYRILFHLPYASLSFISISLILSELIDSKQFQKFFPKTNLLFLRLFGSGRLYLFDSIGLNHELHGINFGILI